MDRSPGLPRELVSQPAGFDVGLGNGCGVEIDELGHRGNHRREHQLRLDPVDLQAEGLGPMEHAVLRTVWNLARTGNAYHNLGAGYYARLCPDRTTAIFVSEDNQLVAQQPLQQRSERGTLLVVQSGQHHAPRGHRSGDLVAQLATFVRQGE